MRSTHERSTAPEAQPLLERLEHTTCPDCGEGSLVRRQYKGNDAVVCDRCDLPTAQTWETA